MKALLQNIQLFSVFNALNINSLPPPLISLTLMPTLKPTNSRMDCLFENDISQVFDLEEKFRKARYSMLKKHNNLQKILLPMDERCR